MRITFMFKRGTKWELCFGYDNSMWSSMYGISFIKWVHNEPDEYCPDGWWPMSMHFWLKHPKFWFKQHA